MEDNTMLLGNRRRRLSPSVQHLIWTEQISGGNAYLRKVIAYNCSSILLAVQIQLFTVDENRLLAESAANQLQTGCWPKVLLESHLCSLQRAVCDQTQERNNSDECFYDYNFDNHVTSHVRSWTGVELLIIWLFRTLNQTLNLKPLNPHQNFPLNLLLSPILTILVGTGTQ